MTGGRHSHGKNSTIIKVKRYSKLIKGGPSLHLKSLYSHSNAFVEKNGKNMQMVSYENISIKDLCAKCASKYFILYLVLPSIP